MDVERAKKILVRQRHDTSIQSAAFVHYGMLDLSPETLSHPIMKKNLDTIRRAVRQGQGKAKVMCHLIFGVLALTADPLLRFVT